MLVSSMNEDGLLTGVAANILKRAVELDTKKRYTESLVCYQEGLQVLVNAVKSCTDVQNKAELYKKIESYMTRAEKLKLHVETEKKKGSYHEQIMIDNNSTGHSYHSIFSRFLDSTVCWIVVQDPYIRAIHQIHHFLRFCELVVKLCEHLEEIHLVTVQVTDDSLLQQLQADLKNRYNVNLFIEYSATLHDREIRLSNGWIVKIGRGLDYFKRPENKFCLGMFDTDLRQCHETTVDVFHNKNVKKT